jgi:hypothetical protein
MFSSHCYAVNFARNGKARHEIGEAFGDRKGAMAKYAVSRYAY